MKTDPLALGYHDRSLVLSIFGGLLLLIGVAAGILAPLEIHTFSFFSEGGRFHYEGFGYGSFMFANIASQVIAYYLIAAVFIPLGYGHLKHRRWIRVVTPALLWFWLVIGLPVILLAALILLGTKVLLLFAALAALLFLGTCYFVLPWLLIRFYGGDNVRLTLEKDSHSSWLDALPVPILVLSALYLFLVVVLHILILLNGIFPLFGVFQFGLSGVTLLTVCAACLVCLTWGTLQRQLWAWWGAVVFLGLFTASTLITLVRTQYPALLSDLAFPPTEIAFLKGIPLQGVHLAILAGLPLLATWILAVRSKGYFCKGRPAQERGQRVGAGENSPS